MKLLFSLLACAAALAFTSGCGTPTQNIATANYLAGNAFSTYELGKNATNLKGLQDLQAALPDLVSGKVTPFQMGVLNAELQPIAQAAQAPQNANNAAALNQIGSLLSAAIQANAGATGGLPDARTALIGQVLTDFAMGIGHGIQFWLGQQSTLPHQLPQPITPAP